MKKILLFAVLTTSFTSCNHDQQELDDNIQIIEDSNVVNEEASGPRNDYHYKLVNGNIILINDITTSNSRSISDGDTILDFSYIPTIGRIIETVDGKFLEVNDEYIEFTIPNGTEQLHLHQFSKFNEYIYYGIDNCLYREPDNDFDTILDGEVVVEDFIFDSNADTLVTNLHYIVDTDGRIKFWPGDRAFDDIDGSGRQDSGSNYYAVGDGSETSVLDYEEVVSITVTPEETFVEPIDRIRSALHTANTIFDEDGRIYSINGTEITFELSSDMVTGGAFIGNWLLTRDNYGQAKEGYVITNRMLAADDIKDPEYNRLYSRDTMFREYWDHLLYNRFSTERDYLGVNFSDVITVKVFNYDNKLIEQIGNGFTIDYEIIDDEEYIPNMWVDTDNTVWIARGNEVTNFDADGNELTTYTFNDRIDAFTILPSGELIVMDMYSDWFNSDGTVYTGDNVVAQY